MGGFSMLKYQRDFLVVMFQSRQFNGLRAIAWAWLFGFAFSHACLAEDTFRSFLTNKGDTLEAKLVGVEEGKIILKSKDEKLFSIFFSDLSKKDRSFCLIHLKLPPSPNRGKRMELPAGLLPSDGMGTFAPHFGPNARHRAGGGGGFAASDISLLAAVAPAADVQDKSNAPSLIPPLIVGDALGDGAFAEKSQETKAGTETQEIGEREEQRAYLRNHRIRPATVLADQMKKRRPLELAAQQALASVAFNTPEKVPYGEPSYIQFLLNPKLSPAELSKLLKERGPTANARIKFTREMEVTLTGDEFAISPISAEKQMIALDDTTEWKWSIVPNRPGKHRVHLVVNAIIRVNDVEMRRSKSFDRYIEIEVTGFQQTVIFMQDNWQWLALGIVPLVFLVPFRRRQQMRKHHKAVGQMPASKHDETRNIDIFISYSSRDRAFVLPLVESLRSYGYNVWVDQGGLHGASQWSEQIVAAIQSTASFILVSSRNSFSSHNVVKEVSLASEQRKPVIPVFIEQVEVPQSLQYQLAGLQRIEYSDLHHEDSMRRIVEALSKLGVVPAA